VGLFTNAAQAGFVACKQRHDAGLVGQRAEGQGENHAVIDDGEFLVHLGFLGDHFAIDEGGFDGGGAANAPTGGEHLSDQTLLLEGDRFVHGVEVFAHALEVAAILASKEDGVAGCAAVAERISRGYFFPLVRGRTMGLGAVNTGAFGLSFCRHNNSFAKSLNYATTEIGLYSLYIIESTGTK